MKKIKNVFLLLFTFTLIINAQPSPPQNLMSYSVKIEYEGYTKILVKLTWDKVSDSEGNVPLYNIYRKNGDLNSSSDFQKIAQVLWNSMYGDDKVTVGETYTYYVTAERNGESERSNYTEIKVTDSSTVEPTTFISGNVVDESNNLPLKDIYVSAISPITLFVDIVQTDSLGNFKLELSAGEYIIYFRASQDYFPEFYDNATNVWDATRIELQENEPYPEQLMVALRPINSNNTFNISGKISDTENNPLESIINVINMQHNNVPYKHNRTKTGEDGNFSIDITEGSEIILYADPMNQNFQGEFFENSFSIAEAKHFKMVEDFTNVNFILEQKIEGNSTISGKVMNQNEEGVDAMIVATKVNFDGFLRDNTYRTFTDENGNYLFKNLSIGEYILFAVPEEGYLPKYYGSDSSNGFNWHNADIIVLDNNSNLENIDFILQEMHPKPNYGFAEISGTVENEGGIPLSNIYVYTLDENNNIINYSLTDKDGRFTIFGLAPGSYKVNYEMVGQENSESKTVYADYDKLSVVDFSINTQNIVKIKNSTNIKYSFELNQNYPNPFNPTTNINFTIAEPGFTKLTIYDVLGREVKSLLRKDLVSGNYSVTFNASNLPSGIYIYELNTEKFIQSKKMLLIK